MNPIDLNDLPLADLREWLQQEARFDPKAGLLLPNSIQPDNMAQIPMGTVELATATAVPNATLTLVVWDTLNLAPMTGGFSAAAAGLKVPRAGWYWVTAALDYAANGVGHRQIRPINLTTSVEGTLGIEPGSAVEQTQVLATTFLSCAAGDTIGARAYQSSGGALNISPGGLGQFNYLNAIYLSI